MSRGHSRTTASASATPLPALPWRVVLDTNVAVSALLFARGPVARVRLACTALGLKVLDYFDSPITGGDGNREFFLHASR